MRSRPAARPSAPRAHTGVERFVYYLDRATAVILFGAVPLSLAPGVFFFLDVTPKAALALLASILALLSLSLRSPDPREFGSIQRNRWFMLLLSAGVVILVLATLHSHLIAVSIFGSDWRRFGLLTQSALAATALWLWVRCHQDPGLGRFCLWTMCIAGLGASLYGIAQYFGVDPFLDRELYRADVGPEIITRPPSTFGHAIYFAAFCIYAAASALALARTAVSRFGKIFGFVVVFLALVGIWLSGTRAAIVGVIMGCFLAGAISMVRWRRALVISMLLVPIVAAAFFGLPVALGYKNRFFRDIGGTRGFLWRDSARLASGNALIGIGPEVFARELPRYRGDDFAVAFPDFYDESPHNLFMDAWVALGVPGMVMAIVGASLAMIVLIRVAVVSPGVGLPLCAGFAAALFGMLLSCFTVVTAVCFLALPIIGLSTAVKTRDHRRASLPVQLILASFFLAAAAAIGWGGFRMVRADYDRGALARLVAQGRFPEAIARFEQSNPHQPEGTAADLWFSRRMTDLFEKTQDPSLKQAAYRASLEASARAATDSDPPSLALYEMASLEGAAGRPDETERYLHQTLEAAPNWYRARWALAELFAAEGRKQESALEAERAIHLLDAREDRYQNILARLRSLASVQKK